MEEIKIITPLTTDEVLTNAYGSYNKAVIKIKSSILLKINEQEREKAKILIEDWEENRYLHSDIYDLENAFSKADKIEYLEFNSKEDAAVYLSGQNKFKNLFRKYDKIIFHADYIGVGHWVFTKDWKTKQPYIAQLKDDILEEMNKQNLLGKVDFSWVPGHQNSEKNEDAKWNNVADLLAKGEYNE